MKKIIGSLLLVTTLMSTGCCLLDPFWLGGPHGGGGAPHGEGGPRGGGPR
ncbi:hypothetical protein [Acinetobacter sp. HY1485]|nr:hypothetical protein [Acinetobacter sp. HY1485]